MRLAGVAMVKNECDIVELFLKINLRIFDFIHVVDHLSDDGTAEVVKELQGRGLPIGYELLLERSFNQSKVITAAVRKIAETGKYDYIVPLDADEFLAADSPEKNVKDVIASFVGKNAFALVPWKTYVPIRNQFYSSCAPLFENFRVRKEEPIQYFKVVLGNEFAKSCIVTEGNHFAKKQQSFTRLKKASSSFSSFFGKRVPPNNTEVGHSHFAPKTLPLILQHVPVRSSSQIIRKAILGSHTLALKKNRGKKEGVHWDEMANRIRRNGYFLSDAELAVIAFRYGVPSEVDVQEEVSEECCRIGADGDSIEFKHFAEIQLLQSFDSYISALVSRLNA